MPRVALVIALLTVLGGAAPAALGRDGERTARCANLRHAARTPSMVRRGWLRGDVTGDGVAEKVAVVEDPHAAFRCRFAIALFARGRVLLQPLGRFVDKPAGIIGGPRPLIRLLAPIDSRRGAEILAAVSNGASSEQVQLLTVRDGHLERFGLPRSFGGVLAYGSFITAGNNFDCPGRGAGEILEAGFGWLDTNGRRVRYTLVRYRIDRLAVRKVSARTAVRGWRAAPPRWWKPYFEERTPFGHCAVVVHP